MNHLAFDLGLGTTGLAWNGGSDHFICPSKHRSSPLTDTKRRGRYEWWHDTFRAILVAQEPGPVIVEAPFIHNSHPTGAIPLIQLHGLLLSAAIDDWREVHVVENRTLKKWATGNGNASKDDMIHWARAFGWEGTDHNEADAYLLWHYWAVTQERAA